MNICVHVNTAVVCTTSGIASQETCTRAQRFTLHAVQVFGYQINNGVPIVSWYDDMADRELVNIMPFIKDLASAKDVRPLIAQHSSLHRSASVARSLAVTAHPWIEPGNMGHLLPLAVVRGLGVCIDPHSCR